MDDLENKIEGLASQSGLTKDQIRNMIEATVNKYNKLITEESAISLIAKELGLDAPSEAQISATASPIGDLVPALTNITITGRIAAIFNPVEFNRKDATKGVVQNLEVVDGTGSIRVAFWDRLVAFVRDLDLKVGNVVKVTGGSVKEGFREGLEFTTTSQSRVFVVEGEEAEVVPEITLEWSTIEELVPNQSRANIKGKIAGIFPPKEFSRKDGTLGKVASLILVDETGECRVTFWDERTAELESFEVGQIVEIQNAAAREGFRNDVDLTVNRSSLVTLIEDEKLSQVEIKARAATQPGAEAVKKSIAEIEGDERSLKVVGKVTQKYDVRVFSRKDGSEGQVASLQMADETGSIRASFWDEQVDAFDRLSVGDILRIDNAYSKSNEYGVALNVGSYATVVVNPNGVELNVKTFAADDVRRTEKIVSILDIDEDTQFADIQVEVSDSPIVRTIEREDKDLTVVNLKVVDGTGTARLVGWNEQGMLLEQQQVGDVIKVTNLRTKRSTEYGLDLVLTSNSKVDKVDEAATQAGLASSSEMMEREKQQLVTIDSAKAGSRVKIRGTLMSFISNNCVYKACPKCSRRMSPVEGTNKWQCKEHGEEDANNTLFVSASIEDATGKITAVFLGRPAEKLLGLTGDEAQKMVDETDDPKAPLDARADEILHRQYSFEALVRTNRRYGNNELFVNDFTVIDLQDHIDELFKET